MWAGTRRSGLSEADMFLKFKKMLTNCGLLPEEVI